MLARSEYSGTAIMQGFHYSGLLLAHQSHCNNDVSVLMQRQLAASTFGDSFLLLGFAKYLCNRKKPKRNLF